ncbi:MAG: FAD-dependent oxidoreductase [Planctomycetota bacterium]
MSTDPRVAITGGGITALTAAAELARRGHRVDVFDKARGPGGRTSVRRAEVAGRPIVFNHGCAVFEATDPEFRNAVEAWKQAGVATAFAGRAVLIDGDGVTEDPTRFVTGTPAINAIAKHLAATPGVTFHPKHHVTEAGSGRLAFQDQPAIDGFDAIVLTCPAPQVPAIVGEAHPDLAAKVESVTMRPTWAAMVAWESDEADFGLAHVRRGPIERLIRAGDGAWAVHLTHDFSEQFLEARPEEIAAEAARHVAAVLGMTQPPAHRVAHRWRFVTTPTPVGMPCLSEENGRFVVAGDWLLGDGVEAAWRSGTAGATRVAEALS